MVCLFKQVKFMYEQELYSNCITLAAMVVSIGENNFGEYISPQDTFQVYCYYGDSLFHLQHYRKAETIYRKALQLRKSMLKNRGQSKPQEGGGTSKEYNPDLEIKYKMHLCYVHMRQTQSSIDILQSISAKQRTPKINMCLGQAYERVGLVRPAATAYREALRACPLAIEAADRLLKLMVRPAEVLAIVNEGATGPEGALVTAWLNARAHFHMREWTASVRALKVLDQPGAPLRGCPMLLVALGEVQYYSGDTSQAIITFQRAHAADPLMRRGLGLYAACLAREGRLRERESRLIPPSLPASEYAREEWLVLAYSHAEKRRLPRAAYFAQKACIMDPRDPEALLLKGNILLGMKKYPEALAHFREALQSAPGRYEAYAGLAEAHLALRRPRDAAAVAASACKALPNCPRALTLYANVLIKEGGGGGAVRAKALLERALAQDETHLPAALALSRLLDTDEDPQASIDLLEKQVSICPSAALHQALGEAWARRGGPSGAERALQHYVAALALEPGSRSVLDALAQLDHQPQHTASSTAHPDPGSEQCEVESMETAVGRTGVEDSDTTYDLVAEPNLPSDTSNGQEESETEAVWSDMDLEVP